MTRTATAYSTRSIRPTPPRRSAGRFQDASFLLSRYCTRRTSELEDFDMADQPLSELAIIDVLNTIVDRVKQTQPASTTGKPLSSGLVYSQLILGMPIDPRDYGNPWSPMGGDTGSGSQSAGVPAAPPAAPGATPAPDPKLIASLEAAFK